MEGIHRQVQIFPYGGSQAKPSWSDSILKVLKGDGSSFGHAKGWKIS
ncbi:hypothetical protein RchiOBHm_Chr5g0008821 [Rosa chinensis]|uniref:Uncharacterized protein n=1 Tax=Rosa chinensis TaxID=74649 RepID=A0A2P6Q465_ROSCH|nr:hypothetical protein RchiOBHm_Chr5g0008821 [Rosa chinensis]